MKKILPFLFSAFVMAGCAASAQKNSYKQISMEDAVALMESEEDYVILDVRTQQEYESGHIPGAINVPNESIGSAPVEELPDKEQMILVYCRSGNRSRQAAQKLADQGYQDIREFGGIGSWSGETVAGKE